MTLKPWVGYTAVCDACGEDLVEQATGGEIAAFADRSQAVDCVTDRDGVVIGGAGDGDALVLCEEDAGRLLIAMDEEHGEEAADHARDVLRGYIEDGSIVAAATAWAARELELLNAPPEAGPE